MAPNQTEVAVHSCSLQLISTDAEHKARHRSFDLNLVPLPEHDDHHPDQQNINTEHSPKPFNLNLNLSPALNILPLSVYHRQNINADDEIVYECTELLKPKKRKRKNSTTTQVKQKTRRSTKELNPEPLRPELEAQITALGGRNVKLVIQKYLYPTDVNQDHDRLSIPVNQIQEPTFLTKDDADLLYDEGGELKVKVLEPCGYVSNMILKRWNMNKTRNLNLRTYWAKLMKRNKDEYDEKTGKLIERKFFDAGDIIQVWSFRVSRDNEGAAVAEEEDPGQLWLALINLSRPVPNNGDEQVVQLV